MTFLRVHPRLSAASIGIATVLGLGVVAPRAEPGSTMPLPLPADSLPASEFNKLMTFVAANPQCQSFADGCQICRRLTPHQLACSTPGIACQKGEWACQAHESDDDKPQ